MDDTTGSSQFESKRRASELLEMVREIGAELNLRSDLIRHLNLDYSLDRDLGLDSLARMELLERVERRYGVALSETRLREIETIADLLVAIRSAPSYMADFSDQSGRDLVPAEPDFYSGIPSSATTLTEVLIWHANANPNRVHVHLYDDAGTGEAIRYDDLYQNAKLVANTLRLKGIAVGDAVALMLPTGKDYFYWFWGILIAGCVPVPIYPPVRSSQLEDHLRRHASILNNCRATALVTLPESGIATRLLRPSVPTLREVLYPQDLSLDVQERQWPRISAADTALIQYTSGSTGMPKGVILSHANILANIRAMGEHLQVTSSDVFVSWLPLYHDMGLIGAWLGTLYYSAKLVVMSPLAFLSRPARWLWAMHRHRCTITSAPNFAYELCLKRVDQNELDGLDLHSLRVMCNGAEFVSANTVERFLDRFARYGLKPEAYMSVYGLAESSVGLAFPALGRAPRIDKINREVFYQRREAKIAADNDLRPLRFVACGMPLLRHEIRIVDEFNREVPDRIEGRLQFRGPSASTGYFANPEETKRVFIDSWVDSGDLAYRADHEFFITGRSKDIIIIGGRNLYPDELEQIIGDLPDIRKGCVAVLGSRDPEVGTERLIVVAESRQKNADILAELRKRINLLSLELVGSSPHDIWLAPPHTVLKTSSGKIRRRATVQIYEKFHHKQGFKASWMTRSNDFWTDRFRVVRRLISNGLVYCYTFYFYFLLALVFLGVIPLFILLPSVSQRWAVVRVLLKALAFFAFIDLQISGEENIPSGASILVANHCSYADVFLLICALPRSVRFVAKAELSQFWFSRFICSRLGAEFVERIDPEQGLADARRLLTLARSGDSVLFFPEGTFIRRPGLLPFRTGAFAIAVEGCLPVVPIILNGTRRLLRAEDWLVRRSPLRVMILPAQNVPISAKDASAWGKSLALRDAVRKVMLATGGEPDLTGERVNLGPTGSGL